MVKAEKDTMVYPNDGEWWGAFDSDGKTRLAMNETEWYKQVATHAACVDAHVCDSHASLV